MKIRVTDVEFIQYRGKTLVIPDELVDDDGTIAISGLEGYSQGSNNGRLYLFPGEFEVIDETDVVEETVRTICVHKKARYRVTVEGLSWTELHELGESIDHRRTFVVEQISDSE